MQVPLRIRSGSSFRFIGAYSWLLFILVRLVPGHRPSSEDAIAIIIQLKAARALLRYATAILLNLTTSALKVTDAFGLGSNRIEQLACRLRRRNGKPC
jgi:hypothetical protein